MRGRSMVPLLTGERDAARGDDEPIGFELGGWRGARMGDRKVTWISEPFAVSDWQLFDLASDPGETRDLAEEKPELLRRLVAQWETYAKEVGVVLPERGFMTDE